MGIRTQDQLLGCFVVDEQGKNPNHKARYKFRYLLSSYPETVPFSPSLLCAFLLAPQFGPLSLSLALSLGGFARFLLRFHLQLTRISALVDCNFFCRFFFVDFFGFVYYLFRNFSLRDNTTV